MNFFFNIKPKVMKTEMQEEMINDFIKRTNVFGVVYAREGGIINLDEYLKDFLKFKDGYYKYVEEKL